MAEAPDVVEKGLEELEEEITCPVCQDHFREPKILPCLHYYCKECVGQMALRTGPNSPFACPECRRETFLPQNDPDQLPTAFFVNRMRELHAKMEKAQGKVEAICEMCSGAKAEAFCRQCTEFICNDCVRSHRKMKIFASHKVATLQELKEGGAKEIPLKEAPPSMCKDHDEQLKIYCFDCSCLICRDCIIYDHTGHKSEFVKKSAPRYKTILKESLTPLAGIEANISAATRKVEKVEKEVSEQHKAVTSTIQRSFKQLHEILHKHEKQLLGRASELKQQKLDSLGAQRKGFALATSEIQGLVEFVERSIDNATDEEIMLLQKQIQEQVQHHCEKHECIDLIPTEVANVGVRVTCAEGISDLCQKNAAIILQADPRKCTAEGPGVKVTKVCKAVLPWPITYQYPLVTDQLKHLEWKRAEDWSGPRIDENSQQVTRETPAQMRLKRIEQIRCKVDGIWQKAEETLMSYLLELDSIETLGSGLVRSARKSVVKTIQSLQDLLESRAKYTAEGSGVKDTEVCKAVLPWPITYQYPL